jgi:hypothetical protein
MIISGQSAGGHMTQVLLFAYEYDPIVAGQIAGSGAIGMFSTNPTDGTGWNSVSDASGCGNITNPSQVRLTLTFPLLGVHALSVTSR